MRLEGTHLLAVADGNIGTLLDKWMHCPEEEMNAAQSGLCIALVRWTAIKIAVVATVGVYKLFASGHARWVEGEGYSDNDRY